MLNLSLCQHQCLRIVTLFINRKKLKVKDKKMAIPKKYQKILIATLFLGVVAAALSVPFVYESQTLWYKIGVDKTMLRAGKIAGLLAVVLMFVQVLLGVRGKILQELFGVAALLRWHRANGVTILVLALSHVSLILVPEGVNNLPIGMKYWPEMIGGILFLTILSTVTLSIFRQYLGFSYVRWRIIHKLLGYFVLGLVVVHVLFVSESFQHIVTRTGLIAALVTLVISVFRAKRSFLK